MIWMGTWAAFLHFTFRRRLMLCFLWSIRSQKEIFKSNWNRSEIDKYKNAANQISSDVFGERERESEREMTQRWIFKQNYKKNYHPYPSRKFYRFIEMWIEKSISRKLDELNRKIDGKNLHFPNYVFSTFLKMSYRHHRNGSNPFWK